MKSDKENVSLDALTIIAVGTVAWVLFAMLHELIGHGAIAALLGEKVKGFVSTTVYIEDFYDLAHVSERIGWWGFRLVAAGGTLINLLTASFALWLLASSCVKKPASRYFLWLFSSISIFQQAFWLALMPFASLGGDWKAFFIQFDRPIIWKTAVTFIGFSMLWIGISLPKRLWASTFNPKSVSMRSRLRKLTFIPLLSAAFVQVLSVIWSPFSGPRHTWIVTVFSFLPMILWLLIINRRNLWSTNKLEEKDFKLARSHGWILAGIVFFFLFIFILGPGIGSFDGHPDFVK